MKTVSAFDLVCLFTQVLLLEREHASELGMPNFEVLCLSFKKRQFPLEDTDECRSLSSIE